MLKSFFPLDFVESRKELSAIAGELIIGQEVSNEPGDAFRTHPSLKIPNENDHSREGKLRESTVKFADSTLVPFPFRGRSLRAKIAAEPRILDLRSGEQALASTDRGPVWSVFAQEGVPHFRSGFVLPAITPKEDLKDVLNEDRFFELLPLLHWVRKLCAGTAFEGPPLGACFIFDDPNLHWKRYGFVDFEKIVAHAKRENYHVSFATIPLDSWFTHQKTAELFKNNPGHISLAIHGNNHTKCELAKDYTPTERASLLSQAIRRIERFESRTGLRVSRAMVPPHGACSEEMLAALPRFGFECACISHGSLRAHNKSRPWTKTVGFLSSESVHGCPVLPRWGFAGNTTNAILLAAFLNQRVILRGHHQDLKDGIELLDEYARLINSLGVSWASLAELSRTNYYQRLEGTTCTLKAIGRKLTFQLPQQATNLIVESPEDDSCRTWKISGLNGNDLVARSGEVLSLPARRSTGISLQALPPQPLPAGRISNRLMGRAVVRRVLAEVRDRLSPLAS